MGLIIPDRLPDWRTRLTKYLAGVYGVKFRPGKMDCALFCAGGVEAMTGFDAARGWRGYRTLSEGRKRLSEEGFDEWWDMIADRKCEVSALRVGDLAVIPTGDDFAVGFCMGARINAVGPRGMGVLRLSDAVQGYRI